MKKAVCIILSLCILVCSCVIGAFANEEPDLSFAVASDLHYNIPREELEGEIDDPIYWYANRRCAMEDESGFIIDEFLKQCGENDEIEFVLLSGDLVDNGRSIPQEHYDMAAKLAAFEATYGKQVYVINGNHDASEGSETTFAQFKSIYHDFGYDQALVINDNDCSYTANLGEKYRLIALDSCHETASTEDGMTAEKIDWVHQQVKAANADGRYPILMMHHNLNNHMPLQSIFSQNFIVKFHNTTAELFADWGIKLVFTGHEHCSDVTTFTSLLGNTITDFATTSLTMYPLAYRFFTITEDEIKYESKTIESIDTDALTQTVSGFTQEQIDLMNSGLNAYAKGFLKEGIKYRLSLSLSMEKMGIAEDAFYYDLVYTAVTGLTDILEMPLYGEGSVQELAKEYNIDIPDSDYEDPWDLATELVAAHYEGGENKDLDSTEVAILLRTVALVLRTDLAGISDELFLKAANAFLEDYGIESISDELTKLGTKVFGGATSAEYFLLAIASPILYQFAFDNDEVDDNNGTLDGYGTVSVSSNISNISDKTAKIFSDIVKYMKYILTYLFKALIIFDFNF